MSAFTGGDGGPAIRTTVPSGRVLFVSPLKRLTMEETPSGKTSFLEPLAYLITFDPSQY